MHYKSYFTFFSILFLFASLTFSQQLERKDVPEKYKWNLQEIYKSKADWLNDKDVVVKQLDEIAGFKGHLGESSDMFLKAMVTYFSAAKTFSKLSDYAQRLSDEDLRISDNQALLQQANILGTTFSEKTAYMSPEIINIESSVIEKFFKEKPALEEYKMFVSDITRLKAHTLSETGENLLASFGLITDTPTNVYGIFTNAEFPKVNVTLSTGEKVDLSASAYTRYRAVGNREDRKNIFSAFFNKETSYSGRKYASFKV